MSKTSAAVKNRYNAKAYDHIVLIPPKGKKAYLQAIAAENGQSLNAYITSAILSHLGVDCWDDVPSVDAPAPDPASNDQ